MRAKQIAVGSFAFLVVAGCSDKSPTISDPGLEYSSATDLFDPGATLGWQATARSLVAATPMSPMAAARIYAAVSVAQHKSVMAVNAEHADVGGRSQFEARRGAIAGASARVLTFFFPGASVAIDQQLTAEADATPGDVHPHFVVGLAIGHAAGDASVQHVQGDGFTTPWTGTLPVGPGMWVANGPPGAASLATTTAYFMTTPSQFRPAPPPAYLSPDFNTALAEVTKYSVNRTPAQVTFAQDWNYPPGTVTPPGYFNTVAAQLIVEAGLDEAATAEVFALMHAAFFDALIGCWDAKFYYNVLRPSQADPTITLPIGLPNHPSYPSGHSCGASAAATVLTHFFPSHAGALAGIVADAGLSRIIGGIHYSFDITGGNTIGAAVGQLALATGF